MARNARPTATKSGHLGIEAGGTRTSARWEPGEGGSEGQVADNRVSEATFGPANLQLLSDAELLARFQEIAARFPHPRTVAIGMAGARTEADRQRIRDAATRVWPDSPCLATHDLDVALAAAPAPADPRSLAATVLVLSGTGSCCYGRSTRDGRTLKVGGWGHHLGDEGSAYDLASTALRGVVRRLDREETWGPLGERLLAALQLNTPDALIPWAGAASKAEVAALAPAVLASCADDPLAREIVQASARDLADAALACARRIAGARGKVRFLLAGSVLLQGVPFAKAVRKEILRGRRDAVIVSLDQPGTVGAVALARELDRQTPLSDASLPASTPSPQRKTTRTGKPRTPDRFIPETTELSPTEQRNLRSMNLDQLDAGNAIDLMLSEDARIPIALKAERKSIETALRLVVRSLSSGGRLYYVGAGTSGRLGILDASECPPTFRTPPDLVQGIIAGGQAAVFRSVEGAEDDYEGGAAAVLFRGVRRSDVVVGIAASGRTPFVWGALGAARKLGAATVLLCFNPHLRFPRGCRPDAVIAPATGPEVLTGSTRLKAGTATKLVLNILTTLAMVRLGKVARNLMIDLNPANAKLRLRAIRIVRELTGAEEPRCQEVLEASGWVVKTALRKLGWRP